MRFGRVKISVRTGTRSDVNTWDTANDYQKANEAKLRRRQVRVVYPIVSIRRDKPFNNKSIPVLARIQPIKTLSR